MLNQNSTQITEWSSICQKLGLFEGIDAQNNVNARQQIEKQLGSCYLQYILPFEQYSSTEEGQRDIGNRRVQFQRQLIMRLQQQQQQQQQSPQAHQDGSSQTQLQHHQQTQQVPQNTALQSHQPENQQRMQQNWQQQQDLQSSQAQGSLQAQQQAKRSNTRPKMSQSNDPGNSANVLQASSQFKSPSIPSQSPHPGVVPSSNAGHIPSPSASIVHSQRKLSQNSTTNNTPPSHVQSPLSQQVHQPKPNIAKRRQSSAAGQTPSQQPEMPARITPHESNGHVKPNTIKKYVPIKKESSAYNDWVLKSVSDLGDEIELTKPVYLFAPELGSLNIHALVMSLKNYTRSNPGEASSALNTLLVTTTDPNFAFSLTDAPELLDALVGLGQKILDQITTFEENSSDYVEVRSQVSDAIETTFGKYVDGKSMKGEDVVYVVDSLTGELVADEDSDFEIDDVFSPTPMQRVTEMSAQPEVEFKQCSIPNFISALQCFRSENKHHFSKAQVKGALNNSVFLVDNLITITMTLRNLSFTEQSSRCMSSNSEFKNLVFKIVKEIATRPDAFVLQRKRLCLLKDCLLMLDRNAHFLEVDSMEEAFLTYLLVTSFGPPLEENESRKLSIPSAPFGTFSYLPFSVDVFTKLFVREPKNRALFQAVLSGSLNTASFHLSSGNVVIKPSDHHSVKNLLKLHLNGDESAARTGVLSTRIFKLLMSCIPFTVNGSEYVKFILQRSSTVLQALFGAKLLVDSMISEDVNSPQNILICHWLTQNTQILLFNFMRNTTCAITECVKFEPRSGEHRVISYVVLKSLILTNTLLANAVNMKRAHQEKELECPSEFEACLKIMQDLYRVQPETEFALNTLLAPSVDQDVASEILRFRSLMKNLA
ncbi:hypothetical protein OY671_000594 [Metschnikowia pulcherrima]|nr:hypothetical protein OY671_000594 [Metschnikowia pulcherrima]